MVSNTPQVYSSVGTKVGIMTFQKKIYYFIHPSEFLILLYNTQSYH